MKFSEIPRKAGQRFKIPDKHGAYMLDDYLLVQSIALHPDPRRSSLVLTKYSIGVFYARSDFELIDETIFNDAIYCNDKHNQCSELFRGQCNKHFNNLNHSHIGLDYNRHEKCQECKGYYNLNNN